MHFDAVNYRATVWLNGRLIGRHAGEFIAFTLPLAGLKRRGVNRLVVRTDNRRLPTDFPPTTYTQTNERRGSSGAVRIDVLIGHVGSSCTCTCT